MNFFNKTFLTISLALAIPLTTQANWFSDLKAGANQLSKLTKNLLAKKKTIATGLALSGTMSYGAIKLVNWFYSSWPKQMSEQEMLRLCPQLHRDILFAAEKGFKEMNRTKSTWKYISACFAIALSMRLIAKAHERNFFGENKKK